MLGINSQVSMQLQKKKGQDYSQLIYLNLVTKANFAKC